MINIISAIRNETELETAVKSSVDLIFLLAPNIATLNDIVKKVHGAGKKLFIHIDLAEGIGKDKFGILYAGSLGVDGIISTRTSLIKIAHDAGLLTVQRFFIVDTHSVETTVEAAKASKADMIEVMPGILPKVISMLKKRLPVPIVAGGLIETKEEAEAAAKAGAAAVSTGKKELWGVSENE